MPWSPGTLTVGSFLKIKPPDSSPPRKKKGKKRKLNSPSVSPSPPHLTLLNKTKTNAFPPLPRSSMDDALLEMDQSEHLEGFMETPTDEEAEALLKDDPAAGPITQDDPVSSPTSAVKAAIDAKITEEMSSEISEFETTSKLNAIIEPKLNSAKDSNKDIPVPIPKPLPLFPDGLPFPPRKAWKVKPNADQGKPTGGPIPTGAGGSHPPKDPPNPNPKQTYATKAKTPPKAKTLVEHILFVYSTWTNKAPINSNDWALVEAHLLETELKQDPSDSLIRIANSGYDATHRCGFLACRDLASAEWCKSAIRRIGGPQYGSKGAFRAWAKGEQPEARLCRLFLPTRFDTLTNTQIMTLLVKHNPPLLRGTLTLKHSEDVPNGRAVFVEFDTDSYSYTKSKGHKLEFPLMDIDCQVYIPPKRTAPTGLGISGITRLPSQPKSTAITEAATLATTAPTSSAALSTNPPKVVSLPSRGDPRLNKPHLEAKEPSSTLLASPNKRARNASLDSAHDKAKRRVSPQDSLDYVSNK